MKSIITILLFLCGTCCTTYAGNNSRSVQTRVDSIPPIFIGNFMDDYKIRYSISDTLWIQLPDVKYHIIGWNITEQYLLARNDNKNPSEPGLYTRIDFMRFSNMEPFLWGFCLTTYNAKTIGEAETKAKADRNIPMKGCNGYPFSRMKRVE